jgi:hypothetical protein
LIAASPLATIVIGSLASIRHTRSNSGLLQCTLPSLSRQKSLLTLFHGRMHTYTPRQYEATNGRAAGHTRWEPIEHMHLTPSD